MIRIDMDKKGSGLPPYRSWAETMRKLHKDFAYHLFVRMYGVSSSSEIRRRIIIQSNRNRGL